MSKLHYPAGDLADGDDPILLSPEVAGWSYTGLRVLRLTAGRARSVHTGDYEAFVLPLSGGCTVRVDGEVFELSGRDSVFTRITDFAYVPRDAEVELSASRDAEIALPMARCERRLDAKYGAAEDVPVEVRGAGQATRQVANFGTPGAWEHADKLNACELITPDGNWSSYPPHKHDEEHEGRESELEEIYYFEMRGADASMPHGSRPFGYQRVYGTRGRPINVMAEVRTGDVVLVPYGWHGPSMAPPGYDMYYLNVMAGPGEDRQWLIVDDPEHAWVRGTWESEKVDPRLPFEGRG
jgi:5-deoxy-glucuronate isomerase